VYCKSNTYFPLSGEKTTKSDNVQFNKARLGNASLAAFYVMGDPKDSHVNNFQLDQSQSKASTITFLPLRALKCTPVNFIDLVVSSFLIRIC
jgi:hypothetical protein